MGKAEKALDFVTAPSPTFLLRVVGRGRAERAESTAIIRADPQARAPVSRTLSVSVCAAALSRGREHVTTSAQGEDLHTL